MNECAIRLYDELSKAFRTLGVPFKADYLFDGYQFTFDWCDGDVIAHRYSLGIEQGMVESYRFPWDEGNVTTDTPQRMASRIACLYYGIS